LRLVPEVGAVEILGRPGRPGFAVARFEDPDGGAWVIEGIRPA
jgi:hypothetical protein